MSGFYLALGDSVSIDDYAGGAGRGAASLLLKNRDEAFPGWIGRDLSTTVPGLRDLILAKDGATSGDVVARQLPAARAAGVTPTHVTLTCGGNDLLSFYGDTPAATAVLARATDNLTHVLATLRDLGGATAKIIVTTVYDPSDGTGDLRGAYGMPPWPDGLTLLTRLNEVIRDTARTYDATVADAHALFHRHGVSAGDPAQPHAQPDDPDLWYCGVVEPNAFGAHAIRTCWWQALHN